MKSDYRLGRLSYFKLGVWLGFLMIVAFDGQALADESNFLSCILTANTNTPVEQSASSAAASLIDTMNRPKNSEATVRYDSNGKILRKDERTPDLNISEQAAIISPDERQQILAVIQDVLPDAEFSEFPDALKHRLVNKVQGIVRSFPTSVPGESLTEADRMAKLGRLRMELRALKKIPILSIDDPQLIAKQVSALAELIGDEAFRRLDSRLRVDASLRSAIIQGVEEMFCNSARNTATATFKRALPHAEYEKAITSLKTALRDTPENQMLPMEAMEESFLERLKDLEGPEVAKVLKEGNLDKLIVRSSVIHFLGPAIIPMMNTYATYAAASTDLATADLAGGLSEKEINENAKKMEGVLKREQERRLAFQAEALKSGSVPMAKARRLILIGVIGVSAFVAVFAFRRAK